jgi:RNA polymerase sigma-70 factor (ECF subfamily)
VRVSILPHFSLENGFSMKSDRELIELANNGDSDAFEALYYRYRDWVYCLACRFTNNRQDVLDVVQETFTCLLGKFPGFELTASMTTFLYPVVKRFSCAMRNKSRRFTSEKEIPDILVASTSKETTRSRPELAAVLAGLSDEQREVMLMRFVDDMNLKEIAEALNIPISTAKSRLYRALRTLRNNSRTKGYFLE